VHITTRAASSWLSSASEVAGSIATIVSKRKQKLRVYGAEATIGGNVGGNMVRPSSQLQGQMQAAMQQQVDNARACASAARSPAAMGEPLTDSPRVSVAIVNYNYAQFLPRSIESALAQDWPNKEVIVVDDCSTDNSREVIRTYGDRITPVLQPQNRGHGAAMNAGFLRTTGEIVIFLDADDYLYPNTMRRIVESRIPGAAQYQYRLDLVDGEGRVMDTFPPKEFAWEDGDVTHALLTRGRYSTTVTSGLAFSRRALDCILPMDEHAFRMGGDGYLVTVAPFYGQVVSIEDVLGAYQQHGGNHSQFGKAIVDCVRWRIEHDHKRYEALARHAKRQGREASPDPWQHDPFHLEGRMAFLLLSPNGHPNSGDTRRAIAKCALAACHTLPMSQKRREFMMLWWRVVGWGPLPLARSAVRWKLQAASRPIVVKRLAKLLRAAAG
jgi:hypothetical protein